MPAASVQYQDDEREAMARVVVTLLAHLGVSDVTAGVLLDGASGEQTERMAVLLDIMRRCGESFPMVIGLPAG